MINSIFSDGWHYARHQQHYLYYFSGMFAAIRIYRNPRDFLANTKGIAARANAVQQNSFESLPLFLTAILMAEYMVVPEYFILRLGWAYIILRIIYGICYLCNWATLRSIVWFLSLLCPIFLLIVTIKLT